MAGPTSYADVTFPLAGVDVSDEQGQQPLLTAAHARNVRAAEPLTGRMRGGSRCGHSRAPDDRLPHGGIANGTRVIQHLAVLVDPTTDFTLDTASVEYEPGQPAENDGVVDPSTNNLSDRNPGPRYVRDGGDGRQIHRRHPQPNADTAPSYSGVLFDVQVVDDCGPATGFILISDAFGPGLDQEIHVLLTDDSCADADVVSAAQALVGESVTATPEELIESLNRVLYSLEAD